MTGGDYMKISEINKKLENYFSTLNDRFFQGDLEVPMITVSPAGKTNSYGWFTTWKAWKIGEEERFEINICSDTLNRPIAEVLETLLHEMVHLKNGMDNVQDCSRGGTYHNKKFKETAEKHGLEVEKTAKYGFSSTSLNAEAKNFIDGLKAEDINVYRADAQKVASSSNSIRYECPMCGIIARTTKRVNIRCGECDCDLVES